LSVEVGKLAQQANGSVVVQYGDTVVLVTAVMGRPKTGDFFPLTVEYEEKYYAAGKIKGSKWIKRETRPSDEAILSARLIDRTLRPRFDQRIRNEVQVVVSVLSFDGVNDPDMVGLFGASLALMISDIPFRGPVAGIRVGRDQGQLALAPTYLQRATGDFDIAIGGTAEKINMLEAGANIVPEADIVGGVELGFKAIKELTDFQNEIAAEQAKPKREMSFPPDDTELANEVHAFVAPKLDPPAGGGLYTKNKQEFYANIHTAHEETVAYIKEKYADHPDLSKKITEAIAHFEHVIDKVVHKNILASDKRPDGRKLDELREIWGEVGLLPHTHGSGLFNRGQTQALSILTLAAPGMEQWIETMEINLTKKRFMHHYVFPPFSVGETGRMGGAGRREIGHGALAERSLLPIIPHKEEFPYTVRVVSEILGSNGSSSMASVCGATLAMMDGGVPIKAPAAGIAMGLMFDEKGEKYKILTDIQGPEDHHGDMDMKVAGTAQGVTGMQMDVKIDGITVKILSETLSQARKARLEILASMEKVISAFRDDLSSRAPRVKAIKINPAKIGALIGPGGKMINEIIERTGTDIDIDDDGTVFITSMKPEGMDIAIELINQVTYEVKAGDEFDGTVVSIRDFGAFVEIMPGHDGMVHVSEMSEGRVNHPSDAVAVGQQVHVWVKSVGDDGKVSLSMVGPGGKSAGQASSGRPPRRSHGGF